MSSRTYVADEQDLATKLAGPPAIFLSAGVPWKRTPLKKLTLHYLRTARPANIRQAVGGIARGLLRRGVRLVFGAQPALAGMLLSQADDVRRHVGSDEPRLLIFQSRFFEGELPETTLDLASWEGAQLVFTPDVPVAAGEPREAGKDPSLELMRKLMVSVPDLRAAIFVGGMEGIGLEAEAFRTRQPDKPMYAFASTGSAAADLFNKNRTLYSGGLPPSKMQELTSYERLTEEILERLKIGGRPQ